MKIVFTTKGNDMDAKMDPRFGRAEYLLFLNEESNSVDVYDNRAIANEAHGAGPKTAQLVAEKGAEVIITGNGLGGNAASVIDRVGITVYSGAGEMTVQEAYDAYKNGKLNKAQG